MVEATTFLWLGASAWTAIATFLIVIATIVNVWVFYKYQSKQVDLQSRHAESVEKYASIQLANEFINTKLNFALKLASGLEALKDDYKNRVCTDGLDALEIMVEHEGKIKQFMESYRRDVLSLNEIFKEFGFGELVDRAGKAMKRSKGECEKEESE